MTASKKLPIAAIDSGVLHVKPAKFYLTKGGEPWVGADHKWLTAVVQDNTIELKDKPPIVDQRAYIQFRGPETNEGRKAVKAYADIAMSVKPEGDEPLSDAAAKEQQEALMAAALDLTAAMTVDWLLFDEDGQPIDIKPHDVDDETGQKQVYILYSHWASVAPRKLLEMANFLRDLKNF